MPDYMVSVDYRGERREGYILAKDRDVALSRFLRLEGIDEDDVSDDAWAIAKVYHIRMDRLNDYLGEPDPWGCGFKRELIDEDDGSVVADIAHDHARSLLSLPGLGQPSVTDPKWHAARIVYLTRHIDQMLNPICIDNQCAGGRIYPIPEILDGWHRYYAHLHLGFGRIRCTYGGLLDLLHYLEGKTDECPEF